MTPAVRIRPCERVASSPSHLAARRTRWAPDGPRGVARASRGSSAGSSALIGSALPASRFRRRSGIPFHTADRKPSLATFASLSLARPFRARTGERRRRFLISRRSLPRPPTAPEPHPPGLSSSTAHEEPRIRFDRAFRRDRRAFARTRACHTRHLPASAFRTLSPAYTPQHRPGFFHPGNALEVPPSGPRTSPGSRTSLEAACSLAVSPVPTAAKRWKPAPASEL